jgi:hypothetical protein
MRWEDDNEWWESKDVELGARCLFPVIVLEFVWDDKENQEKSVTMFGKMHGIRKRYLKDTSEERYHYATYSVKKSVNNRLK